MDARIKERLSERALILKALSHPLRLFIVEELAGKECCVNDLALKAGVRLPILSRHLSLLRLAGLLSSRKEGSWVYYSLGKNDIHQVFSSIESVLEGKTRRLKALCRTEVRPLVRNKRIPRRTYQGR